MAEQTLFPLSRVVNEPIRVAVHRIAKTGPDNPMWKGGRSVASNGYVLVRVGTDHHLADVRGYAYEHRVVAEEKIGRRLVAGEEVHHVNGNKQDNRPENLEVCQGRAEHFVHHRTSGKTLRMPGEDNPDVSCACGCGTAFTKYDGFGRPRRYLSGHNPPQAAPTKLGILASLAGGAKSRRDIAKDVGARVRPVAACLNKMRHQKLVQRKDGGLWQLLQ